MKTTRALFILAAAAMLASCGQNNPAERSSSSQPSTPSSESSQTSQAPSSSSSANPSSQQSSEPTSKTAIRIAFYEKFVTPAQEQEWVGGFENYLKGKSIDLSVVYISLTPSGNGAAFGEELKAYNDAHANEEIDALLGARANLGDYISANYSAYPDGSTTYVLGDQTNRILYLYNATKDSDRVAPLTDYLFAAAEPEDSSSEILPPESSEAPESSEESLTPEESSQEASSEPEVDTHQLNLYFYKKFATQDVADAFVNGFRAYLTSQSIDVIVTYTVNTDGNTAALDTDLSAYNAELTHAKADALLGAKANLGTYCTTNYSVYQVEEAAYEFTLGEKTDRRLYTLNDSPNVSGIEALKAYVITL